MPKLRFLALLLIFTLNVANAMTLDYIRNHSNIKDRFEWDDFFYQNKQILSMALLESNMIRTRFEFKQKDLLLLKELPNLRDKDYNAFGIPLPKQIIFEVLNFHKNHDDEFSLLVKQYPFAQLIFSQWQTIKLYEKHKELTNNPKLTYKDFMQKHFRFTYNGKNLNIYEAIAKMRLQERNNADDEHYSIISNYVALADYDAITLYDFVYDIIPNSIKREFLRDESTMKSYLPLKSESFEYAQNNFKDKIELHKNIYGDKPFNEKNIKKEWHTINALNLKGYDINSKELIIPKAKQNKLGIAYNELWELINVNQNDLELPKTPIIKGVNEFFIDYSDWKKIIVRFGEWEANNQDLLFLNEDYSPTKDDVLWQKIDYQAISVFMQNNFQNNQPIFEYWRKLHRDNKDFTFNFRLFTLDDVITNANLMLNTYIAYRFNQALALAFVGAYHKGE